MLERTGVAGLTANKCSAILCLLLCTVFFVRIARAPPKPKRKKKKKKKDKPRPTNPTIKFFQEHLGPICLAISGAVLLGGVYPSRFQKQFLFLCTLAYARESKEGELSSDGNAVPAGTMLYSSGMDDAYFVGFMVLVLTAVRWLTHVHMLKPLARGCGVPDEPNGDDEVHKFAESGWQLIYYAAAWGTGCSIQYNSSWWFGVFGGREDWGEELWRGYPQNQHTSAMKLYYLLQLAFWLHMIFITVIEKHRSDFVLMMVHHFITSFLVGSSYIMNYVRIGTAVLVEQDFADIFLPFAKCLKYMKNETGADIVFALFAVVWIFTRHFVFFTIYFTIVFELPAVLGKVHDWRPQDSHYWSYDIMYPAYLTILGGFQIMLCVWLSELCTAVYKALFAGGVEDHRSDDEDDGKDD